MISVSPVDAGSGVLKKTMRMKMQHAESQVPTEHNLLPFLTLSLTIDGLNPYIWAPVQLFYPGLDFYAGLELHSEPHPIWWDER